MLSFILSFIKNNVCVLYITILTVHLHFSIQCQLNNYYLYISVNELYDWGAHRHTETEQVRANTQSTLHINRFLAWCLLTSVKLDYAYKEFSIVQSCTTLNALHCTIVPCLAIWFLDNHRERIFSNPVQHCNKIFLLSQLETSLKGCQIYKCDHSQSSSVLSYQMKALCAAAAATLWCELSSSIRNVSSSRVCMLNNTQPSRPICVCSVLMEN